MFIFFIVQAHPYPFIILYIASVVCSKHTLKHQPLKPLPLIFHPTQLINFYDLCFFLLFFHFYLPQCASSVAWYFYWLRRNWIQISQRCQIVHPAYPHMKCREPIPDFLLNNSPKHQVPSSPQDQIIAMGILVYGVFSAVRLWVISWAEGIPEKIQIIFRERKE